MALKVRARDSQAPLVAGRRKLKFQADLAPADDRSMRVLKEQLQISSNTDLLADALSLYQWAVSERKRGHRILSESATGERKELLFPRLERVAPRDELPHVEMKWTAEQLESFAELMSARQAKPPTEALIRALRD
ncbi:MAG: hypothetical protein HY820_08405 [Acidobacteria bacterium]|nr:hypothetical protein [Acidobacteriota bacterium]